MKALVTGATGFVGSHLVEALRRRGDEVTALARSASKAAALEPARRARRRRAICTIAPRSQRAVEGQDVIFHVAGVVAARDEAEFLAANRDGTRHVVEAAERAGARRFVLVSSMAAAGPTAAGTPLDGDEPPRPVTAYGRSKLAAEGGRDGEPASLDDRPPADGLRPARPEVLKVFRLARLGLGPGLRRRHAGAVGRARRRPGRRAHRRRHAPAQRPGGPTTPATPRCSPAPSIVRAPWARDGHGGPRSSGPRRHSAARVLGVTEAAARSPARPPSSRADKANEFFQPAWTGDPAPLARDTGWRAGHDLEPGWPRPTRWYRSAGWL